MSPKSAAIELTATTRLMLFAVFIEMAKILAKYCVMWPGRISYLKA